MAPKVHIIQRHANEVIQVTNANALQFGSIYFRMSGLASYAEFTALWDMYKIAKCEVTLMFNRNVSSGALVSNTGPDPTIAPLPIMRYVKDFDDLTAPTSVAQLTQYSNMKIIRLDRPHKITIYPKAAAMLYRDGVATAYGPHQGWIDCSYPEVPHYGIKYCIECPYQELDALNVGTLTVSTKYTLKFKGEH